MKAEDANSLIEVHAHDGRNKHPPDKTLRQQMSHVVMVWGKLQTTYQAGDVNLPRDEVARRLAQLASTCKTVLEQFWEKPTPAMAEVKTAE